MLDDELLAKYPPDAQAVLNPAIACSRVAA
jgi:hypothetical protein